MTTTTTTSEQHCMKKPPRPWSADINHKRKMVLNTPEANKCYTSRSDTTHDKCGRAQEAKLKASCCLHGCRNPPNTPVCAVSANRVPQLPGRQPLPPADEGRCIRLRTISHSAPPLNFPNIWNPLIDRHPGSAFDIVSSSAGSSRTCTPEQTESRAEVCRREFEYDNPIVKPVPVKRSNCVKFYPQISEECVKEKLESDDEETLPDRLFREQIEEKKRREEMIMKQNKIPPNKFDQDELDGSESDCSLTLPDKIFKAHMAKQALERGCSPTPSTDVKPKIIGKSGGGSIRNGLKDKFVLNIIESFNDQSNALKELSNMKLDSNCSERKSKKSKKKSFGTLKKTWSSIMNMAVGIPSGSDSTVVAAGRLHHAQSKDNVRASSKKNHVESLYKDSMYSTLVGDIYKSRSTACIAAL